MISKVLFLIITKYKSLHEQKAQTFALLDRFRYPFLLLKESLGFSLEFMREVNFSQLELAHAGEEPQVDQEAD